MPNITSINVHFNDGEKIMVETGEEKISSSDESYLSLTIGPITFFPTYGQGTYQFAQDLVMAGAFLLTRAKK